MTITDLGQFTGTSDKDYDLLLFTETCLDNALRLQTYINDAADAGDEDLRRLFERAQTHALRGADEGKQLLKGRI